MWKGTPSTDQATIEATIKGPEAGTSYVHALAIGEHGGRVEVLDESIGRHVALADVEGVQFYYRFNRGNPELRGRAS